MEPVISVIRLFFTNDDNDLLMAPFTKEEFRVAMFSIHPGKCPSLDDYNCWSIWPIRTRAKALFASFEGR
jgi:hypothetical protein